MPRQMTCPACGEEEDLVGERTQEGIRIRCGSCDARWDRDTPYTCATCGGADIHMRPQALTQYSRGSQLSIVSLHYIPLCGVCDAGMLARANQQKPVPGQYQPAAAARRGDTGEGESTLILPR
ncbi:hydrogenase maturation nickel metallochaperone HypA [Nocardiopsis deserti]|uniref:hydrogenase maturation nickel metallochaperone HypA n=1 Tax=Nocardiopsis deserti TaxID=2605988 RepID=UPI00123B54CF|nr:hydrogenase maturation nickel metallochaperone HypA [Nocardiopsis deserti]